MHRFGVPWHIGVSVAIVAAILLQWRIWREIQELDYRELVDKLNHLGRTRDE